MAKKEKKKTHLNIEKPKCGICGTEMKFINPFWKCPVCKSEMWPDEARLSEIKKNISDQEAIAKIKERIRWSVGGEYAEVLPPIVVVDPKSGGSRSSGRKRKKKPKLLRPYELI